jgi:hypothetical protein
MNFEANGPTRFREGAAEEYNGLAMRSNGTKDTN